MNIPELAKTFFQSLDEEIGPFDRPLQFHPFPFDAGGSLNFLSIGAGKRPFVTYVSWDLFGHPDQRRGDLGRYELITTCDSEDWCLGAVTNIGKQSLQELFSPGDTLDIGAWVGRENALQGVVFEEVFKTKIGNVQCGLLGCIGITRPELEFAIKEGASSLIERLKRNGIYPHTVSGRKTVNLSA